MPLLLLLLSLLLLLLSLPLLGPNALEQQRTLLSRCPSQQQEAALLHLLLPLLQLSWALS